MDLPNKSGAPAPQPPKKEIKALVSGDSVTQVARPATRRFLDHMFAESPKTIAAGVFRSVVGPRFKSLTEEALNAVIHGIMWGGQSGVGPNIIAGTVLRGGAVNYQQISSQSSSLTQARQAITPSNTGGNYQDLLFNTMGDAEMVLARLIDLHNQYRVVTIADLYELVEKTPSISDNGYGWTTLDTARITPANGGFLLQLPRPVLVAN